VGAQDVRSMKGRVDGSSSCSALGEKASRGGGGDGRMGESQTTNYCCPAMKADCPAGRLLRCRQALQARLLQLCSHLALCLTAEHDPTPLPP
jgi:hypothetical protein